MSDAAVRERTGYRPRTVRLAFQELADLGMAEVGRAADGDRRLVRPLPHPLWAAALALVPTADEGAVQ